MFEDIRAVSSLIDPLRRQLYEYVVAQPAPVSREEAGAALEIPAHRAKFHLDRLAEEGLLGVDYQRLTGRSGPGAGRPAKLYYRSDPKIDISLPRRRYGLVIDILAASFRDLELTPDIVEKLQEHSYSAGKEVGERQQERPGALATFLEAEGYEPTVSAGGMQLGGCPFQRLGERAPRVAAIIALSYLRGLLAGAGITNRQIHTDDKGMPVRLT